LLVIPRGLPFQYRHPSMTHEENRLHRQRHERIARVKRLLRRMPRRTNVHRYPVLKWFAGAARKRSYLWSFRIRAMIPAFYAGCILSLLPVYGIQIPLAVGLAFLLRANLPVLTTLQFITNPLTALPAYFAAYQVGRVVLTPFGFESPHLNMAEMKQLLDALDTGNWGFNLKYIGTVWLLTSLGGTILGTFLGALLSGTYRLLAYEVTVFNARIKELQRKRQEAAENQPPKNSTPDQESNASSN